MEPSQLIKSFETCQELDEVVAELLINEFQKPGLILLPVGSTFEQGIYPKVNEYFKYEEIELRDTENQDPIFNEKHHLVSKDLKLTHLDEVIDKDSDKFATALKNSLPNVISQVKENFYEIDTEDVDAFDKFIKLGGGPRLIVFGLGSDPEIAHVAFIGEEFINSTTAQVKLSETLAKKLKSESAITIGTDIFKSANLERIIVVAKGKNKAKSLANAFNDPDTGLGYIIKNYSEKLKIYADHTALADF